MGPINIVWYRFTLAFLILFIYALVFKRQAIRDVTPPPLWALFSGAMLAFNYFGYMKGVELGGPNLTQILIQMGPLMLALAGVVFFKERLSQIQFLGVIISILGYSLFYYQKWTELKQGGDILWASLVIFFAAFCWASYAVAQKKLKESYEGISLNIVTYGLASLVFLPFVQWHSFTGLSLASWGLIIFLGMNTVIAYGCLIEAFKYLPANQVSVIITLNPILTLIITYLLYFFNIPLIDYDILTVSGYIGALCVVLGAVIVIGFSSKN